MKACEGLNQVLTVRRGGECGLFFRGNLAKKFTRVRKVAGGGQKYELGSSSWSRGNGWTGLWSAREGSVRSEALKRRTEEMLRVLSHSGLKNILSW